MMKTLSIFLGLLVFSLGVNAKVEVFGHDQAFFHDYPTANQIPNRLDVAWSNIQKFFVLDAKTQPPIVYLFPFRSKEQPAELSLLQDRQEKYMALDKQPQAMIDRFWHDILKAITFGKDLFDPGSTDAGRIVQVNVGLSYLKETSTTEGYGIYITMHEMVHVALNSLGIDMKYQHCMMAQFDSQSRNFMQMLLDPLIAQGWAAPSLREQNMFSPGFGEEQGNCNNDLMYVRSSEGDAAAKAYEQEVSSLTERLIEHAGL